MSSKPAKYGISRLVQVEEKKLRLLYADDNGGILLFTQAEALSLVATGEIPSLVPNRQPLELKCHLLGNGVQYKVLFQDKPRYVRYFSAVQPIKV